MKPNLSDMAGFLPNIKPNSSPYYPLTLVTIMALFFINVNEKDVVSNNLGWTIFFSISSIVFILSLVLVTSPQRIEKEQYESQIKFARTLGLMGPIISLAIFEEKMSAISISRFAVILTIIINIIVFSLYIFKSLKIPSSEASIDQNDLTKKDESKIILKKISDDLSILSRGSKEFIVQVNNLQLSYITNSIIVAFTFSVKNYLNFKDDDSPDLLKINHWMCLSLLFYLGWIFCMIYWIYQIKKTTSISFSSRSLDPLS